MCSDLPEPRPQFIDRGDHFFVDPARGSQASQEAVRKLLAMTPDERWRWHGRWRNYIKELERAGKDVGKEIYGVEGLKRPSEDRRMIESNGADPFIIVSSRDAHESSS